MFEQLFFCVSDLWKSCFSNSKGTCDIKLHQTKCAAIAHNILGQNFEEQLLEDLGSREYSLLIDDNNIFFKILLGIVRWYYS